MHANQYNYDIGFRVRCKDKAPICRQLKTFSILYMLNNPTPSWPKITSKKKSKKLWTHRSGESDCLKKELLAVNGFERSLKTGFFADLSK